MKISFFTIVLNGMPFLPYLIESMINSAHEWFFVEGATLPKKDTSFCNLPPEWSYNKKTKLSVDGTTDFLNDYTRKYPKKIKIIRKMDWWHGKVEMCNSFLDKVTGDLLWQVDADEFWTKHDINKTIELLKEFPHATAVRFYSKYFVGDCNTIVEEDGLGNASWDWYRLWPYKRGYKFHTHEPPTLVKTKRYLFFNKKYNLNKLNPIDRNITKQHGICFYHYAYVDEKQVRFKEDFYPNFEGFTEKWYKLRDDLKNSIYKNVKDYWGCYGKHFYGNLCKYNNEHPLKNIKINYEEQ